MGAKIKYVCPNCSATLTVFVKLSEPPYHTCTGSRRPQTSMPMFTEDELKESTEQS
jgi:hypothetical protein